MHPYRIYVYGNPRDVSLIKLFQKGLPDFGTVEYKGIERGRGARRFLLEEGEEWPQPGTDGGLLLFKKNFSIPAQVWPLPGWMSVINSPQTQGLRALQGTGIPVITCGASIRDTLSISSWDFPQCSISLLRGIPTMDGGFTEPGEIPVYLREKISREEVLLYCGVLLACGISLEEGLKIPAKI